MTPTNELHEWKGSPRRLLGDGRQACLEKLTFGRGRICVGREGDMGYSMGY